MMDPDLQEATEIANEIEDVLVGHTSAAAMYALGMVIAHGVSCSVQKDVNLAMKMLGEVAIDELKRHFSN